jgi:transcription elongation factor Elf1
MEVEVSQSVECPFCGHVTEVAVDTSTGRDEFTVDCEVCARPFEVRVESEPGRVLSVNIDPG